jgi:trk system potassium uptake protein TrkA
METIELRGDIAITELRLTDRLANQSIRKVNFRQKYNLNIIALEHDGETTTEISPDFILSKGDNIVVIGRRENINKLENFLSRE